MNELEEKMQAFADAAFPLVVSDGQKTTVTKGLSKRELFAAMAMQGFVLHYAGYVRCNFDTEPNETAKRAVKYADALIKELDKGDV